MADLDRLKAALADRYTIERELGQGGMATVYLARDLRHDREVAIKVLKPELAAVIGADRFIQEIKTTAALQHPNILPLFDSGTSDSFLFYVMPFVEGETLRDKLDRERQLGVNDAVKIAIEVADALDYAHRHGIIHRDIKPENILLHDGRPMVADFGIALAVSAASTSGRMTETGLSLGTPHYMSPEQATAEREITARSDVYSLGAVLYEMLTGTPPHTGASAQQIIMKIVMEDADLVTKHRKTVPRNVAAAVATSLAKLPADRFESARAFAAALENPAYGAGTVADASVATARANQGVGGWIRQPLSWLSVALVLAALVFADVTHRNATRQAHQLVSFEQKTFRPDAIFAACFASDGKTIVFSSTGGSGITTHLNVIRPEYPEAQRFGPDSTQLLAISATDQLAVLTGATYMHHRLFIGMLATMPLGGGSPRPILDAVTEADWAPGGDTLAAIHLAHGAYSLEYPIGNVLAESHGYLSDLRISPDGKSVAYFDHPFNGDDRGTVVVIDRNKKVIARSPDYEALEGLGWQHDGKAVLFANVTTGAYQTMHVSSMDLGGTVTPELASAYGMTLQDVTPRGAWLVTQDLQPSLVFLRAAGSARDVDFGWLDFSNGPALSHDGKWLTFSDQSTTGGPNYSVMVRKTDGTPAVRLGEGTPTGFSTDGATVFASTPTVPPRIFAYPTGPGAPTRMDGGNLPFQNFNALGVLPDGKHYVGCGSRPHEGPRCYVAQTGGTTMTPITPIGWDAGQETLSPDGEWLAATSESGTRLFSTSGQPPRAASGTTRNDVVIRWSPDGRELWVKRTVGLAFHVERVDVQTGRRGPLAVIAPSDSAAVQAVSSLTLADDPRVYAYEQTRYTSSLFVVTGIH